MRIVALSVFEGVIYHCHPMDLHNPCKPTLEVDARTQPGDLDAGPLMMTLADYIRMIDVNDARHCVALLRDAGRIKKWMGVDHLVFPTWVTIDNDD
jgi:hypothetical protein